MYVVLIHTLFASVTRMSEWLFSHSGKLRFLNHFNILVLISYVRINKMSSPTLLSICLKGPIHGDPDIRKVRPIRSLLLS